MTKLSKRSLSFEESSLQAEIFLDALNRVIFLPCDCHSGLNMLQSIYKLFWLDLLEPFRDFLQCKCVSKDIQGCYFQALQLLHYSDKDISLYLICLQRNQECYEVSMSEEEPSNVLCQIALDFEMFLSCALLSSNKHLKLVVNFILVLSDFLEFLGAYRL